MIDRTDVTEALAMLTGNASDKTPDAGEITVRAWVSYFGDFPGWSGDDLLAATHQYCRSPRERMVQPADLGEAIKRIRADAYDRADPDTRDAYADLGGLRPTADALGVRRDKWGYIDKTAPDPEPYPAEWTPEQRVAQYWSQLRNTPAPAAKPAVDLPWFDPFSMPPCPDCGSTRSCLCHEFDRPPRHPNDELPPASPQHIRRVRAWLVQHEAAKCGAPIPPVETAGLSPLSVACPYCKATAGERCINPRPGNAREPFKGTAHPSRLEAVGISAKAQAGARQVLVDRARAEAAAFPMPADGPAVDSSGPVVDTSAARGQQIAESGVHAAAVGFDAAEGFSAPIPGGGYRDAQGQLHFPDTDALDTKWAARYEQVFG